EIACLCFLLQVWPYYTTRVISIHYMRSLISPANCFILFIWLLSKIVIMTPAIARAMPITRSETTIAQSW
ncbi:MAG TPA: hypothetical protein VFZ67_09450, partial [Nitrososphaera sp.]